MPVSTTPVRYTSGFTHDALWQPLGKIGMPNPFFFVEDSDDFAPWRPGGFTLTNTGNGTIAPTPGAGGIALFTTNSSTPAGTDLDSLQRPSADMGMSSSLKSAFLCRMMLPDVTNPQFTVGWLNTTTTPFAQTDGVYFNKASGSTAITINVMASSVVTGTATIPFVPTNSVFFDLGWYFEPRDGTIKVFAGSNLVGNYVNRQNTATLGPVAVITPTSLPTVALNPTLALQSGTATSKTMQVDFFGSFLER